MDVHEPEAPRIQEAGQRASMITIRRSASAVLRIDRTAIQENYAFMRSLTGPEVQHGAVLKRDAYGLGARPIAEALIEAGCSIFFVADVGEALALRAAFPEITIVALEGYADAYAADYAHHDIFAVANDLAAVASLLQRFNAPRYILNVDTGLSRRGLRPSDVTRLYFEGVFGRARPAGIMSHLACSADPGHPLNAVQQRRFLQLSRLLAPAWASLAASSGVWLGPRFHFDVTRLGSALLGLNDPRLRPTPLKQILNLSAPVIEVRALTAGESVGYGATFRAGRPSRIAVIAMGYAQGLPWGSGNRISGHVGEFAAPVVGRLSMDYLTLDVTDVPEALCHQGSLVSLLDERATIDDMADATGVAAQEILLRLGSACQRDYSALTGRVRAGGRAAS